MADPERPSPFTISEPIARFAEGPASGAMPSRSMTVGELIINLIRFADFYEQASLDIERAQFFEKPYCRGTRDANAEAMQREFQATVAIDRVRAYVLAKYSADLTIKTARKVLGDLINRFAPTVKEAEGLRLDEAMDRLEATKSLERDARTLESRGMGAGEEKSVSSSQVATAGGNASIDLMRVLTNGIIDSRIEMATQLLANENMSANDKLTKIDSLMPIPTTASAEQLGVMLKVTKQAVLKTEWWIRNRKGEKESEVGRRRDGHRKRANNYEAPDQDTSE